MTRGITYLLSAAVLALGGCEGPIEEVFLEPFESAPLIDLVGSAPVVFHVETLDGVALSNGVLVLSLANGGILGLPLDERGEVGLRFDPRDRLEGRFWAHTAVPELVVSEEGAWRNSAIQGRIRITKGTLQ